MYLIPAAALSSDLLAAFESGSAHDASADELAALAVDSLDGAEGWMVDEDGDTHYRAGCYKIVASALDHNGVRVDTNSAESLGAAYSVAYDTEAEAEAVAADLRADDIGLVEPIYTVVTVTF